MTHNFFRFFLASFLLLTVFSLVVSEPAVAEDDVQCLAVYPCLDDGQIDPKFNVEGTCGDKFRALCKSVESDIMNSKLNFCENKNAEHNKTISSLQKQNRRLQKQLRVAKTSRR